MARFRVKELAQSRGLRTEDLAYKSGVPISTLRSVMQGRTLDPSYSTLAALARALECTIEELVVRDGHGDGSMEANGDRQINRAPELQPLPA